MLEVGVFIGRPESMPRALARSSWRAPADSLCFVAAVSAVSPSVINQQPTQNWHGQGESDCLIKTKHCDGQRVMLTQCDFCPVL